MLLEVFHGWEGLMVAGARLGPVAGSGRRPSWLAVACGGRRRERGDVRVLIFCIS